MLCLSLTFAAGQAAAITCPADAVAVGPVCVDKYEASVWAVPDPATSNKTLVARLKKGTATLGDLVGGGATQLGCDFALFGHDPFPANFPADGNWSSILIPATPGVYAASVPGVLPSACITWFQSQQACLLSDKRLLTNAEWQAAAAGTPDPGATDDESADCNVSGPPFGPTDTGSRSSCKSNWGASDLVGNVYEWVADWVPRSTACPGWGGFSDDFMCLTGASEPFGPGAVVRGGAWGGGAGAGVFAVDSFARPSFSVGGLGLRCAR
jgi:formylglycine-generating enzyme required for sulfatase activity